MARRAFVAGASAVLSSAASACVLFPSLDSLTSGPADSPADAAGVDAEDVETDAGASPATCPSGALFCDGFESGNTQKWETVNADLPLGIAVFAGTSDAGVPAFGGRHALIATADAVAGRAFLSKMFAPASAGTIALRAFVWFTRVSSESMPFLELVDGSRSSSRAYVQGRLGKSGRWETSRNDRNGDTQYFASATPVATGRWICVELVVSIGVGGHVTLLADGAIVVDVDVSTLTDPTQESYSRADVGIIRLGEGAPFALHADDVVIAHSADDVRGRAVIGCP